MKEALASASDQLRESSDTARLDAELLLEYVTGTTRLAFITDPDMDLSELQQQQFFAFIKRRQQHEPVAYLTGRREFFGRSFTVSPEVLIPRPDTETIVEEALRIIDSKEVSEVLDLGTGSGCIAVTLAAERPELHVMATDISSEAIAVAKQNAANLQVDDRVNFYCGDWFQVLHPEALFSLIVSNPPYVAAGDPETYAGAVFEPERALYAADGGVAVLEQLLREGIRYLNPGGVLLLEIGHQQGDRLYQFVREAALPYDDVRIITDLAGRERVFSVTRKV